MNSSTRKHTATILAVSFFILAFTTKAQTGASATTYYGAKGGIRGLQFIYTTNPAELARGNYVSIGKGWVVNDIFQADTSANSFPIYFCWRKFKVSERPTYSAIRWIYATDAGGDRNCLRMSDGWILTHDSMRADHTKPSQEIHYLWYTFYHRNPRDGSYDSTDRFVYTTDLSKGGIGNYSQCGDGWIDAYDSMTADVSRSSRPVFYIWRRFVETGLPLPGHVSMSTNKFVYTIHEGGASYVSMSNGWINGVHNFSPDTGKGAMSIYYGEKTFRIGRYDVSTKNVYNVNGLGVFQGYGWTTGYNGWIPR